MNKLLKLLLVCVVPALSAVAQSQGPFIAGRSYSASQYLGPYFEMPFVYQPSDALAPSGLAVGYTSGNIYPSAHGVPVQVPAGKVTSLTASKNSCDYPAFSSCDIIYANSSGTVTFTATLATAKAAGNTILAFVETSGSAVVLVTYPYQLTSVFPPFSSSDIIGSFMVLAAGTAYAPPTHFVVGKCTLGTSCSVTFTGAAAFTGTTTYQCTATDQTAAAAVKVVNTSATQADFTGTSTDVISFICAGD